MSETFKNQQRAIFLAGWGHPVKVANPRFTDKELEDYNKMIDPCKLENLEEMKRLIQLEEVRSMKHIFRKLEDNIIKLDRKVEDLKDKTYHGMPAAYWTNSSFKAGWIARDREDKQ